MASALCIESLLAEKNDAFIQWICMGDSNMNNSGVKTQKKTAWQRAPRLARDNSGVIMVITAVAFPLLLAFAGLSLDVGRIYDWKRRQKQAAIAGAMGGAHELFRGSSDADAITALNEDTTRNNFDDTDADITVTVNIPPTSGTHQTAAFVEVIITKTVPTYFTRAFGDRTK